MRYLLLIWLLAIPQLAVAECTTTTIIGADSLATFRLDK